MLAFQWLDHLSISELPPSKEAKSFEKAVYITLRLQQPLLKLKVRSWIIAVNTIPLREQSPDKHYRRRSRITQCCPKPTNVFRAVLANEPCSHLEDHRISDSDGGSATTYGT